MDPAALRDRIVSKAIEFGADDAGVCMAGELLAGPSHRMFTLPDGIADHDAILVIALSHPPDKPELDYFIRKEGYRFGNSEGNRRLMSISDLIGRWLQGEGIPSGDLHYYVERGGVFLKGAAVLAGLGVIGMNNLFIHPGYGPRIRLRAHLVKAPLALSPPVDFDPCTGCQRPCLDVCPEDAFDHTGYLTDRCQIRLDMDFEEGLFLPAEGQNPAAREAHCCRECELACCYIGTMEK